MLTDQAERNVRRARAIHDLYRELSRAFAEATRSPSSHAALDVFFTRPIINGGDFFRLVGVDHRPTALALLRRLTEAGLIRQWRPGSGRRSAIYALERLLAITDGIAPQ